MTRKLAWRQLLSDPPSAWMRLPLLTRGVGDEILRAVDANGEIDCGSEPPATVVCRLAAAHPRERRRIVEAVQELIDARFLRLDQGDQGAVLCVQLPDLSLARAPERHPNRTRTEPEPNVEPARSEPEPNVELTRTQPEIEPNTAESLESSPVEKRREEKKTEEEEERKPETPPRTIDESSRPSELAEAERLVDQAQSLLLRGYQARYEAAAGDLWMGAGRVLTDVRTCARWCAARGTAELDGRAEKLLDGMFDARRDRFAAARWPWSWVARNPDEFASAPAPARSSSRAAGVVKLQASVGDGDINITDEDPSPEALGYGQKGIHYG